MFNFIADIRQYVSVLTLTGSRRKREIPMQVMSLLNDVITESMLN